MSQGVIGGFPSESKLQSINQYHNDTITSAPHPCGPLYAVLERESDLNGILYQDIFHRVPSEVIKGWKFHLMAHFPIVENYNDYILTFAVRYF